MPCSQDAAFRGDYNKPTRQIIQTMENLNLLWIVFALLTFAALWPLLISLRASESKLKVAIALMTGIPTLALGSYLVSGRPDLPGAPHATLNQRAPDTLSEAALIARVEARLHQAPDDTEGWRVLIPLYQITGRYADEAHALEQLARLEGDTTDNLFARGDALTRANSGIVSAYAETLFERALTLDPSHWPSRAYYALMLAQDGKQDEAMAQWQLLASDAPTNSPWLDRLKHYLKEYDTPEEHDNDNTG